MASAPYASSFVQPVSLRRRATAFALALVANLLLLLMLFTLAPSISPLKPNSRLTTFSLQPDANKAATEEPTERAKRAQSKAAAPTRAAPAPKAVPVMPEMEPTPVPATKPLAMILMSKDALASIDNAMRAPSRGDAGAGAAAGAGNEDGADDGAGTGPGGEKLYNAEWYVEPTNAQLAGYLPPNGPRSGWGMIACRTLPQFRVDDCVELGQSPAGSGFARAVRQAAWQFRVRPPRVGDRRLVGAWVKIRITYGTEKAD